VYLLLSIMSCVVWTILDRRRTDYNRLLYWFSQALVMVLSCIVFAYGMFKVFPVQMASPSFSVLQMRVGALRPFDLLWTTYGYGSPYQTFTGAVETISAVLILFPRTRVAGLLIIASVMVNVVMLNYTFQIGVLMLSFYILVVTLFLLAPYFRRLSSLFFRQRGASLVRNDYVPVKSVTTRVIKWTAGVLICCSFLASTQYAHSLFERRKLSRRSAQFFRVTNFVMDSDTLRPSVDDTICWRWWNERTSNGKRYVTITFSQAGSEKTYTIQRDTGKHTLSLQGPDPANAGLPKFSYKDLNDTSWQLEGTMGKSAIRVAFRRIVPDSLFQLLKVRRTIITLDDSP